MILTGLSCVIVIEIYAAVMQREFSNTDNKLGKGFAVLGIYLFVVAYCAFLLPSQPRAQHLWQSRGNADQCRRHAQLDDLALWGRGPANQLAIEGHGSCGSESLYRQRWE